MYSEYSLLKELFIRLRNLLFCEVFTYNHFRMSWYSFLSSLEIDYAAGFSCAVCGEQPQTVIMDCTALSFRKELDSCFSFFVTNYSLPRENAEEFQMLFVHNIILTRSKNIENVML